MPDKPVDGTGGEGTPVSVLSLGSMFGVGEASGVIDCDMQELPACAALVALSGAVAGDTAADAVDTAEFIGVDGD